MLSGFFPTFWGQRPNPLFKAMFGVAKKKVKLITKEHQEMDVLLFNHISPTFVSCNRKVQQEITVSVDQP